MNEAEQIAILREKVFAQDDSHCFTERERYLSSLGSPDPHTLDYAALFAGLLGAVSTPVEPEDVFVGRAVEGPPQGDAPCPNPLLLAKGHLTPDYGALLSQGFRGILERVRANAAAIGTPAAARYAENAAVVTGAVRAFAGRYAEAARAAGNERAAQALSRVPWEPAWDLFSALQSVWMVHFIASCYVGARDYAFGYMDEWLYPYWQAEKRRGTTDEEIDLLLRAFFVKPNEICGRHPHNHEKKPVPCQSAKQYLLLDGGRANALSEAILTAAARHDLPQPEFTVVLCGNAPASFREKTFWAMSAATDRLQVYNGDLLKAFYRDRGLPEAIADRPGFSACCTADFLTRACREEYYLPTVRLFCETLFENEFSSLDDLLNAFCAAVRADCEAYLRESRSPDPDWERKVFVLDALLLGPCNEVCAYPPSALPLRAKNVFLPGLATLGDSLCAIDRLVFRGDLSYRELANAVRADFRDRPDLLARVLSLPKFGNDDPTVDAYVTRAAEALVGAVTSADHAPNEVILPSFYSLERDNVWAADLPATPDGRRAGTPFSENQSPTYGADRSGMTALLNSLSAVPFGKTAAGGLNLTFCSRVDPSTLRALLETYFAAGGLHAGITVLDRATLLDAIDRPERYRSLTVRLYGFSEYFVNLPPWQQAAVLARTAY